MDQRRSVYPIPYFHEFGLILYVTSSTAKSHLKPARPGAKAKVKPCPNMPGLMKAVANFSHEDFYRPIDLAQYGTITLYYRYFNFNGY